MAYINGLHFTDLVDLAAMKTAKSELPGNFSSRNNEQCHRIHLGEGQESFAALCEPQPQLGYRGGCDRPTSSFPARLIEGGPV
jgi:hypothetical protein